MSRFTCIATLCLLLGTGCRTPEFLSNFNPYNDEANSAKAKEFREKLEKEGFGDVARAADAKSTKSASEYVQAGHEEFRQYNVKSADGTATGKQQSQQHLANARSNFESAIAVAPQNPDAHHGLAIIADLQKKYGEAESHYQKALIQAPNNSQILGDMGYSYLLQNRFSESEQYSLRAIQADAKNQKAISNLGDAYARQGKTQLATETYSKLYSPDVIEQLLAKNAPSDSALSSVAKNNSSIFDRLKPGKSPAEKLAADIEQRSQAYNAQQQGNQANNPNNIAQATAQRRMNQTEQVREQLLAIDRDAAAVRGNGPLLLDGATGELSRIPGSESSYVRQQPEQREVTPDGRPVRYEEQRFADQQYGRNQPVNSQYDESELPVIRNEPMTDRAYTQNQMSAQQPLGMQNFGADGPSDRPVRQPWKGIVPASNQMSEDDHADVSHAYRQQPEGMRNDIQPVQNQFAQQPQFNNTQSGPYYGPPQTQAQNNLANGPGSFHGTTQHPQFGQRPFGAGQQNAAGMDNQMSQPSLNAQFPNQGSPNPNQGVNAFHEASKAAAKMGMGVGNGAPFSVLNQSGGINPPGSMMFDSNQTPSPQRWMPDNIPPQNLNDAYQPYPNPVRSPANGQGGQTPPAIYPSYSKEQFGTRSRYDTQTMENSSIPFDYNNSMRGYEAQRWQAGREANIAVKEIWNQGPLNSPLSPSAGSIYTHPSTGGVMYTPNAPNGQGGLVPQWPNQPVAPPGNLQHQSQPGVPDSPTFGWHEENNSQIGSRMPQGQMQTMPPRIQPVNNQQFQNPQQPNSNGPSNPQQQPQQGNANPNSNQRNGVVIPSDYHSMMQNQGRSRNPAPAQDFSSRGLGNDRYNNQNDWPTIIPGTR
ncbi:tetratricopeptide repeat protein [Planctomicrobium sp. SH668]|uniref:tetratricopeptide repeat protein n=1 Tax=Planctomicrobium sp. SH668 TaxID=3448126 RepID=UPI003F5C2EE9